jgi:VRR-NUC domain
MADGPDRNAESRQQAAVVEWIRLVAPQCVVFAVPNGGLRTKAEAARLKWTGALAGVADLVIIDEHGLAYFLEMKSPDGRLSESQQQFRDLCRQRNWPYEICHTVTEAAAIFAKWRIPTREAKR